ncbi:DNA-3-methyladenine glycosylase [Methanoregula sp.]|uniref:DNA-3-methyladenine glycosylase family protein n=1 Tax=Methanoregula sp. TaxID=2052170 RepID=UPI003569FD45
MSTATFTLDPIPPFDFDLTSAIFATGDPQIRIFQDGLFFQALDIQSTAVLVEVRSVGTRDQPQILVTCHAERPIRKTAMETIRQAVATIFSTADDPALFYRAMAADPVMAALTRRLCGLRCPGTPTVFEAVIDSVIEQQISLVAARSAENRLIKAVGRSLSQEGRIYYCYPTPAILAEVPDTVFRSCGLTLRKGEYIRGISREILKGNLDPEAFRNDPDTEPVISELVKIRGIGRWTAELAILRGLHRADAFPADDVAVRRFISRFYLNGAKVSPAEARLFSERWGDYRGFASFYLETAERIGIPPEDLPGQDQKQD